MLSLQVKKIGQHIAGFSKEKTLMIEILNCQISAVEVTLDWTRFVQLITSKSQPQAQPTPYEVHSYQELLDCLYKL